MFEKCLKSFMVQHGLWDASLGRLGDAKMLIDTNFIFGYFFTIFE